MQIVKRAGPQPDVGKPFHFMDSIDPNPQSQTFAVERNPRLRYIIPAVVAVAFLMEQLDSTILVTAVPDIARSLDTTPLRMNLAVTTYILTLAMFIPVSGWFADRFGARRIFTLSSSSSRSVRSSADWQPVCRCLSPRARCRALAAR